MPSSEYAINPFIQHAASCVRSGTSAAAAALAASGRWVWPASAVGCMSWDSQCILGATCLALEHAVCACVVVLLHFEQTTLYNCMNVKLHVSAAHMHVVSADRSGCGEALRNRACVWLRSCKAIRQLTYNCAELMPYIWPIAHACMPHVPWFASLAIHVPSQQRDPQPSCSTTSKCSSPFSPSSAASCTW